MPHKPRGLFVFCAFTDQGNKSVVGHLHTPTVLYCSCLPVWMMNVYFTYHFNMFVDKKGCDISKPGDKRKMCCHSNLIPPSGFFVILVFPFTLLSSYLTPKMPDFDFSLPALTSLSLCLTTAAPKVPARGRQQMDTDGDNGCL